MGLLQRLFARHAPRVWETEVRLLHRFGLAPRPAAVQWIATRACDLTCPHCYSRAGHRADGELSTEEAKRRIVDELVKLGRPSLVIAGGEALLRRDFPEIIAYAHRRRVPWAMHTHGGHVLRHLDAIRAHPPEMVAVSVDGPPAYHDSFRGRTGSFDRAMRAIAALKDAGCPEVVAGTTITRANADLLVDLMPLILESRADSWGFHLVTPEGRAHGAMLPTAAQLRRAAGLARRVRSFLHVELDDEWGSAGPDDCFYRDDPFFCGAGRITCVVTATGEVVPCTTTDVSESQGNVRDRPLSAIWAKGFAAFRSGGDPVKSDCLDCWLQTRNGHSCRGAAFYAGAVR